MKKTILTFAMLIITLAVFSQTGVVISENEGETPDESAMLEIKSNDKGFLIPRMTLAERISITNPAEGLMVYQTNDVKGFYYYTSEEWTAFVATTDITGWDTNASDDITTSDITNTGSGQVITDAERDTWNAIAGVPVGTIMPYAGETSQIPNGWLLCDGSALNKYDNPEYADLFDAIGNNWGGTNAAEFNLPDLRGQFLRGADLGTGNDPDLVDRTGGSANEKIGSIQDDEYLNHNHTANCSTNGNHTHGHEGYRNMANGSGEQAKSRGKISSDPTDYGGNSAGNHSHSITINNSGGNETRPKNAYVNYIIKY